MGPPAVDLCVPPREGHPGLARLRCSTRHDERLSVSSVPTSRPLPSEFSHPALQDLLRLGTTRGSVDAAAVRSACEQADVPMPRMKAVLRALDDAGVTVEVPAAPTSRRAVAAAGGRATASASASTGGAAKTAKPARPAKKAAKKAEPLADGATAATTSQAKPATKAAAKPAAKKAVKAGGAAAGAEGAEGA